MQRYTPHISIIDQELAETRSLLDALLFINEEVDQAKVEPMRAATITILYVMEDKLKRANRELSAFPPHMAEQEMNVRETM